MIIVLTGIDGVGKTTAGQLLAQRLTAAEYPAVFIRDSGVLIVNRHLHCQSALRRARDLKPGRFLPLCSRPCPLPTSSSTSMSRRVSPTAGSAVGPRTFEHLQTFDQAYRELEKFPSFITIDASSSSEQLVEDMLQELGMCGLGLPS